MRARALLAAGALLALCSCGGDSGSAPSTPVADTTQGSAPASAPDALRFRALLVGGGELDMADLAGRPVVLWFWSPYCSICNAEAASIERAAERWRGKAEFVGVAWSGVAAKFHQFIDRHGLTFRQLNDSSGVVFERFDVVTQPAVVIVSADGHVRSVGDADGPLIEAILAGETGS